MRLLSKNGWLLIWSNQCGHSFLCCSLPWSYFGHNHPLSAATNVYRASSDLPDLRLNLEKKLTDSLSTITYHHYIPLQRLRDSVWVWGKDLYNQPWYPFPTLKPPQARRNYKCKVFFHRNWRGLNNQPDENHPAWINSNQGRTISPSMRNKKTRQRRAFSKGG